MLYPEQNEARLKLSLDGTWAFALGSCVEDQFDPAKPLPDAQPIAVPASYNDQNDQTTALRRHYGWAWYQRKVTLPTFCAGQRVVLRFGSVTHTAKVRLNGQLIAQHKGGFTPFEADVTALLHPGETALLTVACDNRVNHSTLPVGNEDGQLAFFGSDNAGIPSVEAAKRAAAPQNRPNFDFFNYAGIHRPVVLYTTPKEYIEDVTIVPAVDGTVQYAVKTTGSAPVHVMVLDADGNAVASAEGVEGTLTIPEVHLWEPRPGTPYLYTLHITCGADVYDQTFGVRSIEVRGTQVLLNGKPLYFKGFCKHEDFTAHGRGFDPVLNVKDVNLIHWANANAVRTSHYPYAEEIYQMADEEGFLIIDEVPAVGFLQSTANFLAANQGNGRQQGFFEKETTPALLKNHKAALTDMIDRDKNHPSVIAWSLLNEPQCTSAGTEEYFKPLFELARRLDPQKRPRTYTVLMTSLPDTSKGQRFADFVSLNRYYGWYVLGGAGLADAEAAFHHEMDGWAKVLHGRPLIFTEYGTDNLSGAHTLPSVMWSAEYQNEYLEMTHAVFDHYDFVQGELVWNFADFQTTEGILRVDGNKKGIFTRQRQPKDAAYLFRERWTTLPVDFKKRKK